MIGQIADFYEFVWDCIRHPVRNWRVWALEVYLTAVIVATVLLVRLS